LVVCTLRDATKGKYDQLPKSIHPPRIVKVVVPVKDAAKIRSHEAQQTRKAVVTRRISYGGHAGPAMTDMDNLRFRGLVTAEGEATWRVGLRESWWEARRIKQLLEGEEKFKAPDPSAPFRIENPIQFLMELSCFFLGSYLFVKIYRLFDPAPKWAGLKTWKPFFRESDNHHHH
jgi:hypothetical protein